MPKQIVTRTDLQKLTLAQLRAKAKQMNIPGYDQIKTRKTLIIALLRGI